MKQTLNKLGVRYLIFGLEFLGLQILLGFLLNKFAPDFLAEHQVGISLGMTVLAVDIIGVSLVWLLTKNLPKANLPKAKLGFWNLLLMILIMAGLAGTGTIIGLIPHTIITSLIPAEGTGLLGLMLGSSMLPRVIVVGILAPICEELIFRKFLIDRLAQHGELVTILASGIMFGLFHGNFQQCFMAMLIGFLFAFVYIRTGKIIYSMILHATMNLTTSVITIGLYSWLCSVPLSQGYSVEEIFSDTLTFTGQDGSKMLIALAVVCLWVMFLTLVFVSGLVVLIIFLCKRKFKLRRKEDQEPFSAQAKALFTSWGMWTFFLLCAVLFLHSYLP